VQPFNIPTLIGADARRILLVDGSVQCVVTSPPFLGLRKYDGTQDGIWGGNPDCDHQWGVEKKVRQSPQRDHKPGGGFAKTRGNETARRVWLSKLRREVYAICAVRGGSVRS